jgi:hypothetical protein
VVQAAEDVIPAYQRRLALTRDKAPVGILKEKF